MYLMTLTAQQRKEDKWKASILNKLAGVDPRALVVGCLQEGQGWRKEEEKASLNGSRWSLEGAENEEGLRFY